MNIEVNCKHCGRYIFTAKGTCVVENIVCPNSGCKAHFNYKIINNDFDSDIRHTFTAKEVLPKSMRKQSDTDKEQQHEV